MSDQQKWDDAAILQVISVDSRKVVGGTGLENGDLGRWFVDSGTAYNIARQIRDDLTTERDALAAELAAVREELVSTGRLANNALDAMGEHNEHLTLELARAWEKLATLRAEVERLRAENSEWDRNWLAMMREIAKFADAMEPDDNEWCDADDATLLEQFDPWQTLRELAAVRAGSYQPVPDGIEYYESRGLAYSVFNDGSAFAVGTEQGGGHFSWPDGVRLCQWQPAQDTQGLVANEYQIAGGGPYDAASITLRRQPQLSGADKWAIYRNGSVLNRDGKWEYEPMPSNRDDEFIARCRFDTPEAALAAYRLVPGQDTQPGDGQEDNNAK